ncbi:glycosyltransferase family 2 protein [Marimonas sp. MJW-29]|uniref:Glycosyltransferase family 2 protein n=1 Tax=Sulfitobacter sediminis TaxID=3234186 RepID=A0ABV3RML9_9RHOB
MSTQVIGPGFDAITPRIFQIGFNKCGTRSLYEFMKQNGISAVHFKRGNLAKDMAENLSAGKPPLEGFDRWIGYTDMQRVSKREGVIEACEFYRSLAAYYPRSYFILNTRSKDRWISSRLRHGKNQNYAERYRKGLGLNTQEELIDFWSKQWDRHHAEVPEFFAKTGQHFLIYDIETDTPDKLSDFLAPDFKTDPAHFGHEGKTEAKSLENAAPTIYAKSEEIETEIAEPVQNILPETVPQADAPRKEPEIKLSKRFFPRNDIVGLNEQAVLPAYAEAPLRPPAEGSTGNVIIACMKNEGPFLLEWIAYHRAIGFHHFLIYTNDCSDGTTEMLDRLAAMGIVTHVDNSDWEGSSPQVVALNAAMKHPVVEKADWLVHIDADEFINIRTGNGTFDCLLDALPEGVTNIAMTWRLFGSAGVKDYEDLPVIEQFDRCAPSYLPKPHIAWGLKTATRNIGAYRKISCHRPNGLNDGFDEKITWVNGSGKDITDARAKNGWRSDLKTIGYDLVQLNHYALRSSDSFLVKRQRGRALHVDRSIGVDYWTRMDWNTHQDLTIKRNLARLASEIDRLKAYPGIAECHAASVAWHREKIASLKGVAEFSELMQDVHTIKLDDISRMQTVLEAGMEA